MRILVLTLMMSFLGQSALGSDLIGLAQLEAVLASEAEAEAEAEASEPRTPKSIVKADKLTIKKAVEIIPTELRIKLWGKQFKQKKIYQYWNTHPSQSVYIVALGAEKSASYYNPSFKQAKITDYFSMVQTSSRFTNKKYKMTIPLDPIASEDSLFYPERQREKIKHTLKIIRPNNKPISFIVVGHGSSPDKLPHFLITPQEQFDSCTIVRVFHNMFLSLDLSTDDLIKVEFQTCNSGLQIESKRIATSFVEQIWSGLRDIGYCKLTIAGFCGYLQFINQGSGARGLNCIDPKCSCEKHSYDYYQGILEVSPCGIITTPTLRFPICCQGNKKSCLTDLSNECLTKIAEYLSSQDKEESEDQAIFAITNKKNRNIIDENKRKRIHLTINSLPEFYYFIRGADKYISLTSLELNLNNKKIGDDGANSIARAIRELTSLTSLTLILNDNNIGDDGANSLARAIRELTSLISLTLNLSDNRISCTLFNGINF